MAGSGFDFQKLLDDSKNSLTNPKGYFSSMAKEGGFVEPVIKALVYGVVAGIISLIWSFLHLAPVASGWGMFGAGAGGVMVFISAIIFAFIGLFVGGIIILIISAICGGNTNFEANTRVSAALMVLSPVNALLSVVTGISFTLGAIISLIVSLYGLYMLYNALVNALSAKEGTAKIISIVLAIIPILLLISTLMCATASNRYVEKAMKDMPGVSTQEIKDMQDKIKELQELQRKRE